MDDEPRYCWYCGEWIRYDLGAWIDRTLGDVCSGDDELTNENGEHTPAPN